MIKVYDNSKDQINAALLSMNNSHSAIEDQILDITKKNNTEVEAIKTEIITNNSNIINKAVETTKKRFDEAASRATRPKVGGDKSWITGIQQINGIIYASAHTLPDWTVLHYSGIVSTNKDDPTWLDIRLGNNTYYFMKADFTGCIFVFQQTRGHYRNNLKIPYLVTPENNFIEGSMPNDVSVYNDNIGIVADSSYANTTVNLDIFVTKLWGP